LSDAERKRILKILQTVILAENRLVDVTLSTTGEQSARQYPFDAADSKTLLGTGKASGAAKKPEEVKK